MLVGVAVGGVPVTVGQGVVVANGVVVGSAIVRQVEENADADDIAERVGNFVKPLVDATKSA